MSAKKPQFLALSIGVSIALGLWLLLTSKNPRIEDVEKVKAAAEQKDKMTTTSKSVVSAAASKPAKAASIDSSPTATTTTTSQENEKPVTKKELEVIEKIRAQAKMSLASGYTAQMAFFAEWDRYTSDFMAAGYMPPIEGQDLNIKMGFLEAFNPPINADEMAGGLKEDPKRMTTDIFLKPGKVKYAPETKNINLNDFSRYCEAGCAVSPSGFEMIVAFPIPGRNRVEVWTINNRKMMIQVQDGLKDLAVENQ